MTAEYHSEGGITEPACLQGRESQFLWMTLCLVEL